MWHHLHAPYGIGKGVALKKRTTDAVFYQQAEAFNCPADAKEEIVLAGEEALLCLYNCKSLDESLNLLRYTRFCHKLPQEQPLYSPRAFHQRRQLPRITARECTSKYSSGKEYRSSLKTGDGKWLPESRYPSEQTCR